MKRLPVALATILALSTVACSSGTTTVTTASGSPSPANSPTAPAATGSPQPSSAGGGITASTDPCVLLTQDMASAVLGAAVGAGIRHNISDRAFPGTIIQCNYLAGAGTAAASLTVLVPEGSPDDVLSEGSVIEHAIAKAEGLGATSKQEPIDGLGEAAFQDPTTGLLFVAAGGAWLALDVLLDTSQAVPTGDRDSEITLARQILDRL